MRADHFYVWTQSNNNQWYNGAIWASSCLLVPRVCEKEKVLGTNFFLTLQSGDVQTSSASMIPLPSYIYEVKSPWNLWPKTNSPRVVGRLGHQSLSSVNQSELIHYNPCALWVKLPWEGVLLLWEKYTALCTLVSIAYLEHVSKMRSHTNLHCPTHNATLSCDTQLAGSRSYLGKWVLCLGRVPCVVTWAFGQSPVFNSIQYSAVFQNVPTARWSSLWK